MTEATKPTVYDMVQHSLDHLNRAVQAFRDIPSANAWNQLMRNALVYQQARELRRHVNDPIPDERLLRALAKCIEDPRRHIWDSIIVECAMSRSISAVLADRGT